MIEYVITEHWNGTGQAWQVSKHTSISNENGDSGGIEYLRTFVDKNRAEDFVRFLARGAGTFSYDEKGNLKPIDSETF